MYSGIATAGRRQKIKQIVLDGELVALGEDGPAASKLASKAPDRVLRLRCEPQIERQFRSVPRWAMPRRSRPVIATTASTMIASTVKGGRDRDHLGDQAVRTRLKGRGLCAGKLRQREADDR